MASSNTDLLWNFPVDLFQPEGSYHFSSDAVLLAQCAAAYCTNNLKNHTLPITLADLGTGCGVIALSFLLRIEAIAVGIDLLPELIKAAQENIRSLGLEDKMVVLQGDISDATFLKKARVKIKETFPLVFSNEFPARFDIITCNPPWLKEGDGRIPPSVLREKALVSKKDTFYDFFSAADFLLKDRGMLFAVSSPDRLPDIFTSLPRRMNPEYLYLIFPQGKKEAVFVILAARKNGRSKLRVEKKYL